MALARTIALPEGGPVPRRHRREHIKVAYQPASRHDQPQDPLLARRTSV